MTRAQRRIRHELLELAWTMAETLDSAQWRALSQRLQELSDAANAEHVAELVSELGNSLATLPTERPPPALAPVVELEQAPHFDSESGGT